jgi:hypothetical protein
MPPLDSNEWPESLLLRWFDDGGTLTVDALSNLPSSLDTARQLIDRVGENFPIAQFEPVNLEQGILGALRHNDEAGLKTLVSHFDEYDFVSCRLGANGTFYSRLLRECETARKWMRPGAITRADGVVVSGKSPSGAARGDSYVLYRTLPTWESQWPALNAVDATFGAVGSALDTAFKAASPPLGLQLAQRSDTFVACFPGDGVGYGSHFDGDDKCVVTAILYTSPAWVPEQGGCLHMLDERRRCWWSVPPQQDTLLLFRADRVLHKVESTHAVRHALTCFMSQGRSAAEVERDRANTMAMMASYV